MFTAEEKEIVRKARDLITPIDRWTQGHAAVDRNGSPVPACNKAAYRFCAHGALWRAASDLGFRSPGSATDEIVDKLSTHHLTSINDGKDGHCKVLALFDKVLAK
jgi:hypothetical protein